MVKTVCFVLGQPDLVDIQGYFRKEWPSGMLVCVAGLTDLKKFRNNTEIFRIPRTLKKDSRRSFQSSAYVTRPHGITSQKTRVFNFNAVEMSNLALL
jgi:hypothetical protein